MSPIKPKISIKDDSRGLDRLSAQLKLMEKSFVKAGILEDTYGKPHPGNPKRGTKPSNPTTVGQVAFFQEFGWKQWKSGTPVPARPFLRHSFDANKAFYSREIDRLAQEIMSAKNTVKTALKAMGFMMRTKIVESIDKSLTWAAKLEPSTVRAKAKGSLRGPNQPLIDSGKLRSSVDFEVTVK